VAVAEVDAVAIDVAVAEVDAVVVDVDVELDVAALVTDAIADEEGFGDVELICVGIVLGDGELEVVNEG